MPSQQNIWNDENLVKILKEEGVAVIPTDTLYGIVGRAENQSTVERIYKIRKRSPQKRCIVLIGDIHELEKFSIILTDEQKNMLKKYWSFDSAQDFQPGPVSVILDCPDNSFSYLHRGTNTLAFRLPAPQELRDLLLKTGPLIAPSANIEALLPAKNITEAQSYFGRQIDLYVDGGEIKGMASKIIKLHKDGGIDIIRE